MKTLEQMAEEGARRGSVSDQTARAYMESIDDMRKAVDAALAENPSVDVLIGGNPPQVMYDNHERHGLLLATIFRLALPELLAPTIAWMYRTCRARGYSYDYFPVALAAWREAARELLDPNSAAEVAAVYDWLLARHEDLVAAAESPEQVSGAWVERMVIRH